MHKAKNIMVCVTQQKTCERLIMTGYTMLKENDNLYIIHVVNEKDKFLNNTSDGEALEYLFEVSKKVGADLTVIRSKDVIKAIGDFAINKNITDIVLGASPDSNNFENNAIAKKINKLVADVDFVIA